MSRSPYISVRGAKENNLKNVDVDIPKNKLVVLTGVSGSGKSSLAFDTIYSDGRRRYMESLSSYARMFLGQMKRPDVESIEGLSPAISISQKSTNRNPRSTVGTVTEIYDLLRLLYGRIGTPHCPECGKEIKKQTLDEMVDEVMTLPIGTKIQLLAPIIKGRKGSHAKVIEQVKKSGYVRILVDGNQYDLSEDINLDKNTKHDIDIIIDRLIIKDGIEPRLVDSIESTFKLTNGLIMIDEIGGEKLIFNQNYACISCGISIQDLEPRNFSFNNPLGACPECHGIGYRMEFDEELIIPDKSLSIDEGAIEVLGWKSCKDEGSYTRAVLKALSKEFDFKLDVPFNSYSKEIHDILLFGTDRSVKVYYNSQRGEEVYDIVFKGIIKNVEKRYREVPSEITKAEYETFMSIIQCKSCSGQRLRKESLAVTVGGMNIFELTELSIKNLYKFLEEIELSDFQKAIVDEVLREIKGRLNFLIEVGLDYLSLSRSAGTLSGGEAQRIRLATQIGSGLIGVDYILDEPSIGLHQRDNDKLLNSLKNLRDLGNSVLVVEHDEDTMYASDYIVDIGPGAGEHGGEIVACGNAKDIINNPNSITGAYLSRKISIEVPDKRRRSDRYLTIYGAKENNLKNIDVSFPLGVLTCVTGVSGSGKSSLINEILYKTLAKNLNRARTIPGKFKKIEGLENLDKVININQAPIGRTPRSNPATYIGVFDLIRDLFASTTDSKVKGYDKGRFSFNVKGGRCEACKGDGLIKIEMQFLSDVYVPCDICKGKRYNRETLDVRYKGKNISDILNMTVEEALKFFENFQPIKRKLDALNDVGLSYIRLGQPTTTLSGGESQRVKLAAELSRRGTGKTMYVMDEPTTGLHFSDVHKLTNILQRLVEGGKSVVVIEHNLDVIKTADYIIDIGPEAGEEGGTVIATGTPEEISKVKNSYTGKYLKKYLKGTDDK